jgi:hypothetical protein
MTLRKSLIRRAAIAAALVAASTTAQAIPVSGDFSCISGSVTDCAVATSTLSWTWDGLDFTIANNGIGYVSEVYFDLGAGMSASFFGGTGGNVFFYSGANPGSLPGGNSVGFVSDRAFDSDPQGTTHNGIDNGETATFRILGAALDSFNSSIDAGLHVRSLINDSVSVITATPSTKVAEPGTVSLMIAGLGLIVFGWAGRRRRR